MSLFNSASLITLKKSIPFFNFLIAVTTILMLISLKKLSYYEKKEAEFKLMKANMESTEQLLNLMHTQRHDYLTHIQSIGALLYLEEYEELSDYLKGISKEYRFTSEIVRIGHPALTALINTKKEIAHRKGIMFYIKCKTKINYLEIDSWDLCSMFSNLIENALEAASMSEGKRWIKVIVDYYDESFIFEVENTGHINKDILEKLFEAGITSKASTGRGYGLYISKKIVNKHNGDIELKNTNHGTVISTIKLPRVAKKYNKKVC